MTAKLTVRAGKVQAVPGVQHTHTHPAARGPAHVAQPQHLARLQLGPQPRLGAVHELVRARVLVHCGGTALTSVGTTAQGQAAGECMHSGGAGGRLAGAARKSPSQHGAALSRAASRHGKPTCARPYAPCPTPRLVWALGQCARTRHADGGGQLQAVIVDDGQRAHARAAGRHHVGRRVQRKQLQELWLALALGYGRRCVCVCVCVCVCLGGGGCEPARPGT